MSPKSTPHELQPSDSLVIEVDGTQWILFQSLLRAYP
jgi:hypothetical protein